jgi:hypothetical protein
MKTSRFLFKQVGAIRHYGLKGKTMREEKSDEEGAEQCLGRSVLAGLSQAALVAINGGGGGWREIGDYYRLNSSRIATG